MITNMKNFWKNLFFKATGWQYNVDPKLLEKNKLLIFEYTSNLDTIILSLVLFEILELKIHAPG